MKEPHKILEEFFTGKTQEEILALWKEFNIAVMPDDWNITPELIEEWYGEVGEDIRDMNQALYPNDVILMLVVIKEEFINSSDAQEIAFSLDRYNYPNCIGELIENLTQDFGIETDNNEYFKVMAIAINRDLKCKECWYHTLLELNLINNDKTRS